AFNHTSFHTLQRSPGSKDMILQDTATTLLGDFPERKEPLRRLTDWRLVMDFSSIELDVIVSFLKFLPELTSMGVPAFVNLSSANDTNKFAEAARQIVGLCPKLRHLSKRHRAHDRAGALAFALAEAMAENSLESFHSYYHATNIPTTFILGTELQLQRHSQSLKSIILETNCRIGPAAFRNFLFEFPALEVLKVGDVNNCWLNINLEAQTSRQWASTKFRDLKLVVTLDDYYLQQFSTLFTEETSLSLDDPKPIPSPPWTRGSDAFFHQIGSLTELRILDLRGS
ncbi:hypothetical protein BGX33_003493, partial [Mortierella sp. NVP41]